MKDLFSIVRYPLHQDSFSLVQSLIYLRFSILFVTAVAVATWHFVYAPINQILSLFACILITSLWSGAVLFKPVLQELKNAAFREILVDFFWVLTVVFFAGRSANPFIYYYLVLTALSACIFPAIRSWSLCMAGILIYSGLLILDVKQHFAHFSSDYRVHLIGMWINYVASSVVTCFFVTRLIHLLRNQQQQLASIREENLKNEQLIGLATVAASTVHNLATPISTLGLLADELVNNKQLDDKTQTDVQLMQSQIKRCHHTMKQLSSLAQQSSEQHLIPVDRLLDFCQEHYSLHRPSRQPGFQNQLSHKTSILCNSLFQYALINLINNALESSDGNTLVKMSNRHQQLKICIENDSELSAQELSRRWGKPDLTEKNTGLGIGSFLANSTIEKQGGTVTIESHPIQQSPFKSHVTVIILMPLATDQEI